MSQDELEDELADEVRALRASVTEVAEVVKRLASRSTVAELAAKTATRTRRFVYVLAAMSVLGALMTGYLIWNNHRVDVLQRRTSNEVLCPLYELMLRSYHPETQPPERLAAYEESFTVIRRSYAALRCS